MLAIGPVMPGQTIHTPHVTDNFYLIADGAGNTHLYNIGDAGSWAEIILAQIKTKGELRRCCIEFGWQSHLTNAR